MTVSCAVLGGDGPLIASAGRIGHRYLRQQLLCCMLTTSEPWPVATVSSMEEQVAMAQKFAKENLLKLNAQKCEIVVFSRNQTKQFPECSVDGEVIPASDVGKCLGYWWRGDQMATRAVEENVKKARRSFFLYGGIGVFQGDLSPLSSRSVVEVCVMPILMYGCEDWIVSEELLRRLESFQEEMGKRILGVSRCASNTAVGTVMGWPSM